MNFVGELPQNWFIMGNLDEAVTKTCHCIDPDAASGAHGLSQNFLLTLLSFFEWADFVHYEDCVILLDTFHTYTRALGKAALARDLNLVTSNTTQTGYECKVSANWRDKPTKNVEDECREAQRRLHLLLIVWTSFTRMAGRKSKKKSLQTGWIGAPSHWTDTRFPNASIFL